MSTDERSELESTKAELALLRTRFEQLVEHSAEAMYLKDRDSRYVYVNQSAAAMMFRRPEELVGATDTGVFAPDVVEEIRADDLHVMRTGQTVVIRTARVMATGVRLEFLTVKRPWFSPEGRILGVIGTTQDVSELATLQRESAETSEAFMALLESASEAIFVHADGVVAYANPAARRILGRTESELVGSPLGAAVRPQDGDIVQRLRANTGGWTEIGFFQADGSLALVEMSDVPAFWCGSPARVAIGRDVTERRQLEGQLRNADRLASAGVLAGSLVHEIRGPLTFVLAASQALREEGTLPPAADARLGDIVDAASRIEDLLSAVSTLARPDGGPLAPVDVEGAIDRALLLGGARMRSGVQVRRVRGGVPAVAASERRLVQVLLNLIVNAAQAVEGGGGSVVEVSTEQTGDIVRVRVHDDGPGVSQDVAARLFKPFATTKSGDEGAGLGLWVSRGIVEEWGGVLRLENPGEAGASFLVELPLARAGAESPAAGPPPPPVVREVRVAPPVARNAGLPRLLLVDDEELIREVLVQGLAGSFEVVASAGVLDALERLEAEPRFDLVLCDLVMPDGGGPRIHAAIAERSSPPALLFMSGGAPTAGAREFLEKHGIEPIPKPFRLKALRERLLAEIGHGS